MIHKFRTPVICQNGHKGLWYWQIENYGIGSIKHLGVISNRCDCPKQALGEGYVKNGDDQLFIGHVDKQGKDIYEGDIVDFGGLGVVKYDEDRFYVDCGNIHTRVSKQHKVIGNTYENPELLQDAV